MKKVEKYKKNKGFYLLRLGELMWFFATNKKVKKSFNKIKKAITELTSQSLNSRVIIEKNKENLVSKDKIDLMIREAFDRERLRVRESIPQTPQTKMRKKADKLLDKAEIMSEINSLLQKELSTEEIYNNIVNIKQLCRKTCFYKYLKKIRDQIANTPRINENE